jgi:hypothetical protein
MASGHKPGHTVAATNPAVRAAAGLLHRRRGWIWTLVVSLAGAIVAAAVAATADTAGTASFLLDLVGLVMLAVFLVAVTMVFVLTARLRRHAAGVRGPARVVHRTTRHPVLAHPHDRRRHPYAYAFGLLMLAGWIAGGVVVLPRLVDSVGYLAGAGSTATFVPGSYFQQCGGRQGCTGVVTNGVLVVDGHPSAATWPAQVPLNVPFTVRVPVWRWALGSGLINSSVTAVGSLLIGLLFEGGSALAAFIILRPRLERWRSRSHPPPTRSSTHAHH